MFKEIIPVAKVYLHEINPKHLEIEINIYMKYRATINTETHKYCRSMASVHM